MLKKVISSFLLAFHNIRSHFFHTILSVLGIVIGVAALVSILSLIDGMEQFAKEQITKTTSLNAIVIHTNPFKQTNGVKLKKDTFQIVGFEKFNNLRTALSKPAKLNLRTSFTGSVQVEGNEASIGATIFALGSEANTAGITMIAGNILGEDDIKSGNPVVAINLTFLKALAPEPKPAEMIGKKITVQGRTLKIQGVFADNGPEPRIGFPITILTEKELHTSPPEVVIEADNVEDVKILKEDVSKWLKVNYAEYESDFSIMTNDARVAQATQAFLLFRIIMGMIVGISVLVGGIGIMNVLLISITERTVEIGIRKAVGANSQDIILQFLAESITVSGLGSLLGLVFGILGTMAAIPIVKAITKVPFQASFTLDTIVVVSLLSLLLGIVFGTYPAIRASRLDPVEAIRRD